jgi:hypothetical protein
VADLSTRRKNQDRPFENLSKERKKTSQKGTRLCLFAVAPSVAAIDCWQDREGIQQQEAPMSERKVVATTIFIAGIMLGAFTVQLKDQIKPAPRNLGPQYNNAMRLGCPWRGQS